MFTLIKKTFHLRKSRNDNAKVIKCFKYCLILEWGFHFKFTTLILSHCLILEWGFHFKFTTLILSRFGGFDTLKFKQFFCQL